jgi:FkbM family methyltransferase
MRSAAKSPLLREPRAARWVRTLSPPGPASRGLLTQIVRRAGTALCARIAFRNWLQLSIVTAGWAHRPADINLRTREGPILTAPATRAAVWPVLEVFGLHAYRFGDLDLTGLHVLDIGAHVGAFSVAICSAFRDTTVVSFEPAPDTYEYLKRNVEQNGFGSRITTHNVAVSDRTGRVHLAIGSAADSTNALVDAASAATLEVESVTLNEVLTAGAPHRFDVCKIDCEGAEYSLVDNTSPESWASIRFILLEYHPVVGKDWKDLESAFSALGFRVTAHERYPGSGMAWLQR